MSDPSPHTNVLQYEVAAAAPALREPWGWIELFAAIQLLWGVLLFIPGAQPYRVIVRALPYVTSLAALLFVLRRRMDVPLAASAKWLLATFALLVLNLLHAETRVAAGIAQVVFQIGIAAPMFWMAGMIGSRGRLARLLSVIFIASFFSAAIGVLQVYFPDSLLPPEFSALARNLNPAIVDALSYVGPDGRMIVRPPGLSDLPGGAALAGLTTVFFAVGYVSHAGNSPWVRAASAGAAAVGMTALYLTQVRSLTVVAALGVLVYALVRLRQGRVLQVGWLVLGGAAIVAMSFMWASAIGGKTIETRFSALLGTGLFTTFQENRGLFLNYTFSDLLFRFPFGAGLGRWGMMNVYFPDPSMWHAPANSRRDPADRVAARWRLSDVDLLRRRARQRGGPRLPLRSRRRRSGIVVPRGRRPDVPGLGDRAVPDRPGLQHTTRRPLLDRDRRTVRRQRNVTGDESDDSHAAEGQWTT